MATVLGCAVAAVFCVAAIAAGTDGGSTGTDGGPDHTSAHEGLDHNPHAPGGDGITVIPHSPELADESLPCTGPRKPVNFESFSAGAAVAGLPLVATVRRCDADAPPHEAANYVSYIYGECGIPKNASDCTSSLQIQTWPACQRSMAEYSYQGKPLPHRTLATRGAAQVVEFDFDIENRIEVYTKSATIVIFADDPDLARKAVQLLRPLEKGTPPVTNAAALEGSSPRDLAAPKNGSMEGDLTCQS